MSRYRLISVGDISRALLFLSSIYFLGTSLFVSSQMGHFQTPYYLYYHFVLLITLITSALSLTSIRVQVVEKRHFSYVLLASLLTVLIWWIYRRPIMFASGLWFDEAVQFLWDVGGNIIYFAAGQQHPPVDYFLSKFAKLTLGISEFSVLFHTLLFGILSFFAFAMWMVLIRLPLPIVLVGLLIFANHHILYRYSSEARPISIGVFFALMVLIFSYESYRTAKVQILPLFTASMLLLMCTGLQPLFFLVLICLSFLPMIWLKLDKKELLKFVVTSPTLPLILFLPPLFLIYQESSKWDQFLPGSHFSRWLSAIGELNFESFTVYLRSINKLAWLFTIPVLIVAVEFLIKRFSPVKINKMAIASAVGALLFATLFPLSFQIFWNIVNWLNSPHYFVLWPVGSLALILLCLSEFFRPHLDAKSGSKQNFLALSALILFSLFAFERVLLNFIPHHHKMTNILHESRPDWRGLIALAKEEKPAVFVEIPFAKLDRFGLNIYHYLTGMIYAKSHHAVPVLTNHPKKSNADLPIPIYRISHNLQAFEKESDMYFLLNVSEGRLAIAKDLADYLTPFADEVISSVRGYLVFKLKNQKSPIEATRFMYSKAFEMDPMNERTFYVQEAMLVEHILLGNKEQAKDILLRLRNIAKQSSASKDPELWAYLDSFEERINGIP